jgi:hypothetical protein
MLCEIASGQWAVCAYAAWHWSLAPSSGGGG